MRPQAAAMCCFKLHLRHELSQRHPQQDASCPYVNLFAIRVSLTATNTTPWYSHTQSLLYQYPPAALYNQHACSHISHPQQDRCSHQMLLQHQEPAAHHRAGHGPIWWRRWVNVTPKASKDVRHTKPECVLLLPLLQLNVRQCCCC